MVFPGSTLPLPAPPALRHRPWRWCWSLALVLALLIPLPQPAAALPAGDPVTDPGALLRDALPMDQRQLRDLQHTMEGSRTDLRAKRWSSLTKRSRRLQRLLNEGGAAIQADAQQRGVDVEEQLERLGELLLRLEQAAARQDRPAFLAARARILALIGSMEADLVQGFPFSIPRQYDALPRLLGRAQVRLHTTAGDLLTVVDGYNAPLTAGAFVDLVQRGFYDGLSFNRAEAFYILQTGDPEGEADGFVDPRTGQLRTIPLEIRIASEEQPLYDLTFEDLGLFKETPVLPFSARGAMGWAHSSAAVDDGSSQFFIFLFESELTPAGLNLIDGRFAAFGYVVEGADLLDKLTSTDRILEATVISGAENLRAHG
ncbi:peptidylprolyl isomerase [Candidatus Synechococcus spongiarum]|uniref:peptidylprolyl isomerase n=1 Tax=Candidatus Synechococcus spongiarum TaxID=431041 RepID=UPI00046EEB1A|nr:peptidylprolyl isomerase [Candidatus Synechococcus spongiarum]